MMQMVTQMVDVNTINQLFGEMVTDDNRVLLVMLPDSESYSVPTEAELAETMKSVDAEQIEAFVDNAKTEPLIPELPAPDPSYRPKPTTFGAPQCGPSLTE